jgi:serpin B
LAQRLLSTSDMRYLWGRYGFGSVAAVAGLGLLSGGCSDGDKGDESAAGIISELRSDAERVTPDVTEATAAAQAEQQFAVSFLHALDAESNVAFSPHSLSTAFAMLTDAAEGKTLAEVEQVLYFGKADDAFHRSQDALQLGLLARNREAVNTEEKRVDAQTLTESNDIWVRDDVPPTPSYLDTLARYYGVGIHQADFEEHYEEARVAINAQVSEDTHALIPELLPKKSIDSFTVAVLTNALYFKAPWSTGLSAPVPGAFQHLDGSMGDVQMLRTTTQLRYYRGDGYVSVALPYYGEELEMQLIVPDTGEYSNVRAALSSDGLTNMVTAGTFERVDLTLPKFELKSVVPALETLKSMGVVTAFDENDAQFPAFASPKFDNVYVKDVFHQATVSIDEKGTEASAATAIVFEGTISSVEEPQPPKVVVADHPFLFVIRDNPTGSILFVGQVVAP